MQIGRKHAKNRNQNPFSDVNYVVIINKLMFDIFWIRTVEFTTIFSECGKNVLIGW